MKQGTFSVLATLFLVAAVSGAYGDESKPGLTGAATSAKDQRGLVIADIRLGEQLFTQNCARCHGEKAEGAPNWNQKGADGKFPPPPLNGTAHAWHHPRAALAMTIRNGTQKIGGNMPAFAGRLDDRDIGALITYINSLWPEELFEAWNRREEQR
jgi:mono/diheme cytochrome c family protein